MGFYGRTCKRNFETERRLTLITTQLRFIISASGGIFTHASRGGVVTAGKDALCSNSSAWRVQRGLEGTGAEDLLCGVALWRCLRGCSTHYSLKIKPWAPGPIWAHWGPIGPLETHGAPGGAWKVRAGACWCARPPN